MVKFETVNELTLKVTCTGSDYIFTKAGAFIAGDNAGGKNYKFEKVLLGPQNNIGQALFGQLARRVTGENLPLMTACASLEWVSFPRRDLLPPPLPQKETMPMSLFFLTEIPLY